LRKGLLQLFFYIHIVSFRPPEESLFRPPFAAPDHPLAMSASGCRSTAPTGFPVTWL